MKSMGNNIISENELQEKILYDIIQYLPLSKMEIDKNLDINSIIKIIEQEADGLEEGYQNAIAENLPAVKAILKDRPELGKAKISNMS